MPTDNSIIDLVMNLAGGMSIAGLMIIFYRKDILDQRDWFKQSLDRMLNVIETNTKVMSTLSEQLRDARVCPLAGEQQQQQQQQQQQTRR